MTHGGCLACYANTLSVPQLWHRESRIGSPGRKKRITLQLHATHCSGSHRRNQRQQCIARIAELTIQNPTLADQKLQAPNQYSKVQAPDSGTYKCLYFRTLSITLKNIKPNNGSLDTGWMLACMSKHARN